MSGYVHAPTDPVDEFDSTKWNPLQCTICMEHYKDPCILQCYHSFCACCVKPRVDDGKLLCPVCCFETLIKDGSGLPPPDPILKFLVESSAGDSVQCANCDKATGEMFYCKTCTQPLCVQCREETHRAKMFSSHHVVLHTKHTRDSQKDCKIHGEPYILFSTEKKVMLCINCFRDMKVESRSHCVDLETAYKQGCQKIDDTMQSIRDLQCSVRDGVLLLRALLEEIQTNADNEKQDISELYDAIQEKIAQTKHDLLQEIDRQFAEKEELFKTQLVSLRTFLPTLHVHLVTCAAFCSSTSKYEFLGFTYEMMRRLTAIIQVQQPLHPSQTSDITTDYKTKLARCLEALLYPHKTSSPPVSIATSVSSVTRLETDTSMTVTSSLMSRGQPTRGQPGTLTKEDSARQAQHRKSLKLKLLNNKGFFADHCKNFDDSHREMMITVNRMKQCVQELQRDITLRRSLARELTVSDLKAQIADTEESLNRHLAEVEAKQPSLEQHWEESLEMIAAEQEVYQAQIQDVCRLKSELCSVSTILQKLTSFMSSIANVTQRLAPKLGKAQSSADQDSQHQALLNTISTMQPDSQQRCDALRAAEEERDIKSAQRTNPLDEELIKTKGLLRAPSARKEGAVKRLSAEIKEAGKATSPTLDSDHKNICSPKARGGLLESVLGNEKNASVTNLSCDVNCNFIDLDQVSNGVEVMVLEATVHLPNKCNVEKEVEIVPDMDNQSLKFIAVSSIHNNVLPDVTAELVTHEHGACVVASTMPTPESEGTSSFSVVTSDSEQETSLDLSSSVGEDSVRPGHVKGLIAKVSGLTKLAEHVIDNAGVQCSGIELSLNSSGADYDRVNKFVSISSHDLGIEQPAADGIQLQSDPDDAYVAKSLPELAQVFESGELMQKKKRNRSEKH
ncbi:RING finger protein 207-like [Dreissena polymorpha]|uniref:RING finger protein 207 n=1 Tax=Dreissena polymorpha TaxID=45954 RepID=A0A9D4H1N7_DREPO|nr:RING finger protein 207-like [Dreissena polymorpha]KAH3826960.1 hypothetical protein DPMN_128888 [Dreissena polymorpha]